MKKTTLILILLITISSFGKTQNDSIRLNTIDEKIRIIQEKQNKIESAYELSKDIIDKKIDYQKLDKKFDDYILLHENSWREFINHWFMAFGTLLLLLLAFFGKRHFIENYEKKIKKEVEEKVREETKRVIKDNLGILEKQLDEIKKHQAYKTNSKILIINKTGTAFPVNFKTVLKLFNTNVDNQNNRIDVNLISEISVEDINRIRKADLVLIENMVPDNVWDVKTYIDDYVSLANKVCDTTTLLYYGGGRLDTTNVDENKQHFVSFVSASSQLYGNMLNLLKYKFELKNAN